MTCRHGAFNAYLHYLKLFAQASEEEMNKENVEKAAINCIILAVKVPSVINFAEVQEVKAIKYLDKVNELIERFYRKTSKFSSF